MASKHQQEDPWAGFVDVLSNILMVVIFLVVILGMAIFALSQQITKVAVENAVKAEREKTEEIQRPTAGAPVPPAPPPSAEAAPKAEPARAETVAAAPPSTSRGPVPPAQPGVEATPKAEPARVETAAIPQSPPADAPATPPSAEADTGAAGAYVAAQARRVRQADEIAGVTNLSVRSVATATKDIEIASEELAPTPAAPVEVKRSQAFLSLKFGRGHFKIDPTASTELQAFLGANRSVTGGTLEIRAFAQSTVGSISEARRIAYYRAMQTRTELVKTGVPATRIEVKIRESISPEEMDVVRVFAKP